MFQILLPTIIILVSLLGGVILVAKHFADPDKLLAATHLPENTFRDKGIPYVKKAQWMTSINLFFHKMLNFVLVAKGMRPHFISGYRLKQLSKKTFTDDNRVRVFVRSSDKNHEKWLLEQIKATPTDLRLHAELAQYYLDKKRFAEARDIYSYLCMHEPANAKFLAKLGVIYYRLAEFEKAAKNFEISISLNSTKPFRFYNLGLCYNELGRYQEAINCFESALKMEPENEEFKEAIKSSYKKMSDKTPLIISGIETKI